MIFRALIIAILAAGIDPAAGAFGSDDAAISVVRSDTTVSLIDACCHKSNSKACHIRHAHGTPELLGPKQPEPKPPSQITQAYIDVALSCFVSPSSLIAFSELAHPILGTSIYLTTLRLRL